MKDIQEYLLPAKYEPIDEGLLLFLAACFTGALLIKLGITVVQTIFAGVVAFWAWTFCTN